MQDSIVTERRNKLRESKSKQKKSSGSGTGLKSGQRHLDLGLPPLDQDYEPDPRIHTEMLFGSGLKRYIHKKTRMPRAVLTIPKAAIPVDVSSEELDRQLKLLCKIDHPNIVPFRECCEDSTHLRLVYEWCDGGLFIQQLPKYTDMLTEGHIAQVIREVFSALAAAHTFGVQHLDIGLFSLFLGYTDRLSPVKVFGIGIAGYLISEVARRGFSKSNKHYYASPEVFGARVKGMTSAMKHACDIWSVGALLFTLCAGRPPFGAGTIKEMSTMVQKAAWSFGLEFADYSSSLKDLLEQLLKVPWNKRPTAAGILSHPWVTRTQTLMCKDGKISELAMKQLNSFAQQDHVKQTVARLLTDIGLTHDAYRDLEAMFKEMDLNADGTLTLGELAEVANKIPGISSSQIEHIVAKLDRNGNFNVDISEFISALVMEQDEADEKLIKKAFSKMDKNGDARVTKKELFKVLRQYSFSIETEQVSDFVGKMDDDKDQKIDYREFTQLFPQVKERCEEIDRRFTEAKSSIQLAPLHLARFKETLAAWTKKLADHRDKVEIACGVQIMPDDLAIGAAYSYEKGHFSEFELHTMVKAIVHHLQNPPGRFLTRAQKKARHDRRRDKEKNKPGPKSMVGLTILTSMTKDNLGEGVARANEGNDSGGESGSEDEQKIRSEVRGNSAFHQWEELIAQDRREKQGDPEYRPEAYLMDHLYWMVKVKSEFQWQLPLLDTIAAMKEACVEDVREYYVERRMDLARIVGVLSDKYVVREDLKLIDEPHPIARGARMLPMGSFLGKNLKTAHLLEKIEEMRPPVHFYFALSKENVTHQKMETMKEVHKDKLVWTGKFVTEIISSLDGLFDEVAEDLSMSGALETSIPSAPPISHLYLKYCEGRGLAEDAPTPRSDEAAEDTDEEQRQAEQVQGGLTPVLLDEPPTPMSRGPADGRRSQGRKIERNMVLTQQAKTGRDARAGAKPQA